MTRGRPLNTAVALLACLCAGASCAGPGKRGGGAAAGADASARLRHEFVIPDPAGGVRVVVYVPDADAVFRAERVAFDRFAAFRRVFDESAPDGEVAQVHANAGLGAVRVSDELYALLRQAERLAVRSDGAVEPTAGAYDALWRTAATEGRLPTEEELARADALVGPTRLRLDPIDRTAHLPEAGTRLDLSPFLRGYACDVVLDALTRAGFPAAMVDAGRRIALGDPPPGATGWPIRVRNAARKAPERTLTLSRQAVASSWPLGEAVVVDGQSYAPVLDPRTAIGARNLAPATAVARRGWQADSLARAAGVLGEGRGRKLARSLRDARVWFHYPPGTTREQFEQLEAEAGTTAPESEAAEPGRDADPGEGDELPLLRDGP